MTMRYQRWSAEEDAILGTMTDAAAAKILGRAEASVGNRRRKLGVSAFDVARSAYQEWSQEEIAMLGTASDAEVARKLGRSAVSVAVARRYRGIASSEGKRWKSMTPIPPWDAARAMPQHAFVATIIKILTERSGRKITYPWLADMTHYSLSRIQKWATAGSAQEPLALSTRHHFWLLASMYSAPRKNAVGPVIDTR